MLACVCVCARRTFDNLVNTLQLIALLNDDIVLLEANLAAAKENQLPVSLLYRVLL